MYWTCLGRIRLGIASGIALMHLTLGVDLPAQCLPSFEWLTMRFLCKLRGISDFYANGSLTAVPQADASAVLVDELGAGGFKAASESWAWLGAADLLRPPIDG